MKNHKPIPGPNPFLDHQPCRPSDEPETDTASVGVDVSIENHGTVFLFRLHTTVAEEWVKTNVCGEPMFFGGALVVEHRFAADVAFWMTHDGLEVR